MRNARLVKLLALLTALLALSGCFFQSGQAGLAGDVAALLDARERGVNGADAQAYLSTVLPSDAALLKEETNLIRAAGSLGIGDYTAGAGSVRKTADGCTALVSQAYTAGGEAHSCAYTASFVEEGGKLYYDGPAFEVRQNDRVKVYYTGGEGDLARQVLDAETGTLDKMKAQLDFAPAGFISVKLFDERDVFLQSIKLDLPAWVGGWHEFGESIKTYTGAYGSDIAAYRPMLNHESTHRMVSELSNDNAAYWLQEGLAGVYENALDDPDAALLTAGEAASELTPYAEQKKVDLEKLGIGDQDAVARYYGTSKAFAAFLLEKYGWGKVRQTLEYMKKYELIDVTGAEKMSETNARTDEALNAVLGLSDDGMFQAEFDRWLENKK